MRSYATVISEVDDSSLLSRLLLTAVTPFEEVDGLNASLVRRAAVLWVGKCVLLTRSCIAGRENSCSGACAHLRQERNLKRRITDPFKSVMTDTVVRGRSVSVELACH